MKKMRKICGLVLAMVMVLGIAMTAMAATVTVPENTILSGHSFVAYQIFTGTQSESEGALGQAEWGKGVNSAAFLSGLKADTTVGSVFSECVTAADVVAELGTIGDNSAAANAVARVAYANKATAIFLNAGNNELATGYYLIVDTTDVQGKDAAQNAALLQVTDSIEITVKTDKPTVDKKVKENVKYSMDEGYGAGYNDVADYNIGDNVPFSFYSKVPDMTYYGTYKYIFHDVMSNGLTLNEDSISVTIGSTTLVKNEDYKVNTQTTDDCTFEIIIDNLKDISAAIKDATIRVDFTAKLNANAVIGLAGNPNKVKLEYSNTPNGDGTGETAWDQAIIFTYELDTTKVDGTDTTKTLAGAEFKLKNSGGKWVTVDENGKVTGWVDKEDDASLLKSGSDGIFKVIGLDDGTYCLKETKAPAGYNLLSGEIKVVISATTNNGQEWTSGNAVDALTALSVTANGEEGKANLNTGIGNITIANNAGTILPETGGMGTRIFYAAGAILVLGAGILLVTKRRMRAK